ncbi:transglutaminase domain-containing protein [uncultured Aquimarina sp.]|uniref:transglutaminase domain-containing protein n=1 Tax=uncultured Aquimarina sp. TaxID=575652 RepID=UPI00262DD500|nr:transglutaminase domain-containing protein [uncultured Aquimarina sp.]
MISKYYFLLLLLFTSFIVTSQKKFEPTEEDILLAKELSSSYPDEDIALLKHSEIIDFDYDKKADKVIVKNKFKQEFINLKSRTEIPLFIGYDDQSKIQDVYVNHRNGQSAGVRFKDEYYNQEELFHSDARIKWAGLNFPLLGYKYTFGYKKKYKDVKYFVNTFLDSYFPIVQKTITVNIPNWLDVEIKEINMETISVKKDKKEIENNGITQYTYTIENVEAVTKEENSIGPTHYRPHLLFLAKSHTKNDTKQVLLNNTKDLYKWYHSLVLQLNNDTESLKEKTLSIIENKNTDEEKIKAIYYWVQDNIRYIAFEDGIAGFKPEEAANVYRKKYGDCKGMANLTKQMMKIAGFDARLSWIGTRRIAYDYSLPTIAVDNHMICTVIVNDQKYFLDATEKYNPLGTYAERIQKKQVLIENDEDYILDTIPSNVSKNNIKTVVSSLKIEEEKLTGTIKRKYEGESKTDFLYNINNLKKDKKNEVLEYYIGRGDKNLVLDDISITDISNRDQDLHLSYNITQNNAISSFENELYIDIDYYKSYQQLDFDKRKTAFVLPYKTLENTSTTIEIPEGYIVKELPKNLSVNNKDFEISFNYKSNKDKIIYEKNINFKNAIISKTELSAWKEFHKKLKKQYQQQIILTKE